MVLVYMVCHGSHQYTPVMLAYIPAPWILWVLDWMVKCPTDWYRPKIRGSSEASRLHKTPMWQQRYQQVPKKHMTFREFQIIHAIK